VLEVGGCVRFDPNYLSSLATSIDQSSSVESNLTSQLSSGLRVTSLQDDPGAVANASMIGSAIARDDSYVQAASGTAAMLQVTDSTLGEVVTQVTSALALAVQGSNGTLNASNKAAVVQQLTGIRDQVLSLANTSYLGQHLFGGSQGSAAPFSLDTSTVPATTVYSGDSNMQSIETPTGQRIQVNVPGSAIFGGSGAGVLTALNQLIADISGGAPTATVTSDSSTLNASLAQVSSQRSILGSSLNRIQQTSTYTQTDESELKVQQGALVSADMASVATQLSSAETQHQALLSVMNALGSSNNDLFSYMK
jgi:flagellar hook-associated protein 3 FlgL